MAPSTLAQKIDLEGITVHHAPLDKLEHFLSLLSEWNQTHNLTAARTPDALHEQVVDALYPSTFIPTPTSLLDVGTGAGFPGMILAIAYPDTPTVLCEPLNKRAAFLRFTALELGLDNVKVARMRVESLRHEPFGLITSRAVTDTKLLLEITAHLSGPNSEYLFYKGAALPDELSEIGHQLNYDIVQRNKRNYLWIKAQ